MEMVINIGEESITLKHNDIDSHIDMDSLTTIDTSNIYGEAVTISAATNRIGLLRAKSQAVMNELKLEEKIYIGSFIANLRKQASLNFGKYNINVGSESVEIKLTEKGLDTSFHTDEKWQNLKREYIKAEEAFNALDSLYWAIQDKSKKLNNLVSGTTPKEFLSEIIEEKINGILITKTKK